MRNQPLSELCCHDYETGEYYIQVNNPPYKTREKKQNIPFYPEYIVFSKKLLQLAHLNPYAEVYVGTENKNYRTEFKTLKLNETQQRKEIIREHKKQLTVLKRQFNKRKSRINPIKSR